MLRRARQRAQPEPPHRGWEVVAHFHPILNAVEADLAVSKLQASGIPALRLPTVDISAPLCGLAGPEPVRVLVPPERAAEARELLAEAG